MEKGCVGNERIAKKRMRVLFALILSTVFFIGCTSNSEGAANDEEYSASSESVIQYSQVHCNFLHYEEVGEDSFVAFQNQDGYIQAIIGIDPIGESRSLTAYLEPGNYYVVSNHSTRDQAIEFQITDVRQEYQLDVYCDTGSLSIRQIESD